MKIAVVGAGAVGLYYGGHLARAGRELCFIVRSGLDALRRRGVRVVSASGGFELDRVWCESDPARAGAFDIVIVAVKATDNPALERVIPPLLKPGTLLLTLQNGLGNEEFLAARWGAHRVLGGTCFVCLRRVDAATVRHEGFGKLCLGEYSGGSAGAAEMVAEIFQRAGIEAAPVDNLLSARWRKLMWNIPFNGLTVVAGGLGVDALLGRPEWLGRVRELMGEVAAIATAEGCPIAPGLADQLLENTRAMGSYKPSTVAEWLEGREIELEAIWGEPLRRAALRRVPTPALARLYEELMDRARTTPSP